MLDWADVPIQAKLEKNNEKFINKGLSPSPRAKTGDVVNIIPRANKAVVRHIFESFPVL